MTKMHIKGTAFVGRKKMVIDKFGQAAWDEFLEKLAAEVPRFQSPIIASTLIPIEEFFTFQRGLLRTFFNDNPKAYWAMGSASAQWSLTEGPYKPLLGKVNLKAFVEMAFPSVWSNYYDKGRVEAKVDEDAKVVHLKLVELPVFDISFELMTMGYYQHALELFTGKQVPKEIVIKGKPGGTEVYYKFYV